MARWRSRQLRIGFTNGCFDLLHIGHLATLRYAKQHCDKLIVGIDDDDSVRALKGDGRPIVRERERAALVGALRPVNAVVIFNTGLLDMLVAGLKPAVLVKGADYRDRDVVGAEHVEQVLFAPMVAGVSTTEMVGRMACISSS